MPSVELPQISWCNRCVYPSSSAIPLSFDENGVCSGCRVHDQKKKINWNNRLQMLVNDLDDYRNSGGYDCVIGVSGGKDSYYQVHFVKEKLALKPLLVTYNGNNFLDVGWKNLLRMKEVFNCDHMIISPSVDLLIRLNRIGFRRMGDMNWHNHCGIFTAPMKVAAQLNIPIVFYGEHGWTQKGGMHSMNDFVEFTKRWRKDQPLRGYEWCDFLDDEEDPIQENEMECFKYPDDETVERVGLRGLYIGMYDPWDQRAHTKLVTDLYGWEPATVPFERTYRMASNLDDRYENGAHDYLKFIKFGYGRATDHASGDIREGYMTRDEGIEMVRAYDHVRSSDIDYWLDYVSRDATWFANIANGFRDPRVWRQDTSGTWRKRNIWEEGR